MGWDPSFFRIGEEWIARGFPIAVEDGDPSVPGEPDFTRRLVEHLRTFDANLTPIPPLPRAFGGDGRPHALLHVRWIAPNGGVLEIAVHEDAWITLDNHAGVDAIVSVYRHVLELDPRFVIFDPEDGRLYDESAFRRSVEARNAAFCARKAPEKDI